MRRGLTLIVSLAILAMITYALPTRQQTDTNMQTAQQGLANKPDQMKLQQIMATDYASSVHLFLSNAENGIKQAVKNGMKTNSNPYVENVALIDAKGQPKGAGFLDSKQLQWYKKAKSTNKAYVSPIYKDDKGNQHVTMFILHEKGEWAAGQINLQFLKKMLGQQADITDGNGNSLLSVSTVTKPTSKPKASVAEVDTYGWKVHMNDHVKEYFALQSNRNNTVDGSIIVQFKDKLTHRDVNSLKKKYGITLVKEYGLYYEFHGDGMPTDEVIDRLRKNPKVININKNYYYEKQDIVPNDEFYERYQWNLKSINAQKGWDPANPTGNETIIAILDTGVDLNHPEFKDKLVAGYNFIANNNQPFDDNGHGTHVAGIAGALTNNYQGIAGVSAESKIMPVKVMNSEGIGDVFSIAQGIRWAVDNGADIINMSLGDRQTAPILQDAINYALSKDVVLVAASGNESTNVPMYPAAYEGVVAVGAYNSMGQRAAFSNYGDHVLLTAPGENIPSTYVQGQYVALSGTSMASPHVAGVAALIKANNPNASRNDIVNTLTGSAVDMGAGGKDPYYGIGRIDIGNAVAQVANDNQTTAGTNERTRAVERDNNGTGFLEWLRRLWR